MQTMKVKGMSCGHCSAAVTEALEKIDGITSVTVDLLAGKAEWEESQPVDREVVKKAIFDIGFDPED